MAIPQINISDYTYDLPDGRIASYPTERRDASKLLLYNKGDISHSVFSSLPDYLPQGALMVFNNTKVVPARLIFRRETGAMIEIFCLEPSEPEDYNLSFASTSTCVWKTIVGNRKKWKGEPIHLYLPENHNTELERLNLQATLEDGSEGNILVRFTWDGGEPFSRVMEMCGRVPIPPYLHRESESIDSERYQTLYASYRGSVAAPTAGLHFTSEVLSRLREKGGSMLPDLERAMTEGDADGIRRTVEEILDSGSYLTVRRHADYQNILMAVMLCIFPDHDIRAEPERGNGRADIVAIPRDGGPNIVIEIKTAGSDDNLGQEADEALDQIRKISGLDARDAPEDFFGRKIPPFQC